MCVGNLSDFVIGKYQGPPLGSLKTICHQILKGVNHLHLLEIVHGDLKPSNILISTPKGALGPLIKVSDFGLRHTFRDELGSEESSFRPAFTEGWMCPSDVRDREGHFRTSFDIFHLALVFGFTVSKGAHPFGTDLDKAIERIKNQKSMTLIVTQIDKS